MWLVSGARETRSARSHLSLKRLDGLARPKGMRFVALNLLLASRERRVREFAIEHSANTR